MLQCGKHTCPQKCHQIYDHSKMRCSQLVSDKCSKGHNFSWRCSESRPACRTCEREDRTRKKRLEDEFATERKLQEMQESHDRQMADIEEQLRALTLTRACNRRAQEMSEALEQKRQDLKQAQRLASELSTRPAPSSHTVPERTQGGLLQFLRTSAPASNAGERTSVSKADTQQNSLSSSPSELEWDRQKRVENASNDAIDELMRMTGLEEVKQQVLNIKTKIKTAQRQDSDLSKERFGIVLLGNPGTGKRPRFTHPTP